MADPASSVAYAIEAALRALGGNLSLLLPTMAVVIGIIAVVIDERAGPDLPPRHRSMGEIVPRMSPL